MEWDPLVAQGDRLLHQVAKDEEVNGAVAQKSQQKATFQKAVLFALPWLFFLQTMVTFALYFHDYMFIVLILVAAPVSFFGFIPFLDQERWIKSLGILCLVTLGGGS